MPAVCQAIDDITDHASLSDDSENSSLLNCKLKHSSDDEINCNKYELNSPAWILNMSNGTTHTVENKLERRVKKQRKERRLPNGYKRTDYHIERLNEEDRIVTKQYFKYMDAGCEYIKINGFIMPQHSLQYLDDMKNATVLDDDVWVCSFPRSGNHWTKEIVWLLKNDLDFSVVRTTYSSLRSPFFEFAASIYSQNSELTQDLFNVFNALPSPRIVMSHLPYDLLPSKLQCSKKAKIIYVTRNVMDVCISNYHFWEYNRLYYGDFEYYCHLFLNDLVIHGPYWDHLLSYKKRIRNKNIMVLTYEELIDDLHGSIRKICRFIGTKYTDEEIDRIAYHLAFENSKSFYQPGQPDNSQIRYKFSGMLDFFLRTGKSSQWKHELTPYLVQMFEEKTERFEQTLKDEILRVNE